MRYDATMRRSDAIVDIDLTVIAWGWWRRAEKKRGHGAINDGAERAIGKT
jgi:regulator of RNase E activity RraA